MVQAIEYRDRIIAARVGDGRRCLDPETGCQQARDEIAGCHAKPPRHIKAHPIAREGDRRQKSPAFRRESARCIHIGGQEEIWLFAGLNLGPQQPGS